MKITSKVLYQRVKGALSEALHLDLSGLGIGAIEGLEICPKLESLDLSRNCLEEVENFECCKNLWRINLSDNKITCLGSLSRMCAVGTLDLSDNNLSWSELLRIRHVFVLDLRLYGNENLENDTFYRLHVIDCLPNIWMLDGRLITCAERLQVQHFFHDSALSSKPVRHKLNEKSYAYFKPTKTTEIHGKRTSQFYVLFPIQEAHNSDTDRRRLEFLAYNMQEDLKNKKKSMKRPSSWISGNCLKTIIENRHVDKEKCNMLLLLLVASIEFRLPQKLISEALIITKLNPLFGVDSEQLFVLDVSVRTEVISLLVSSCKLDREINKPTCGGLYDRLYLCLYHSVSHLLHMTNKSKRKGWFDRSSKSRPNSGVSLYRHVIDTKAAAHKKEMAEWKSHQTLLASELVLLLSVVPSFYQLVVSKNASLYSVVTMATGDVEFYEKLTFWSEKLMTDGGDTNALCKEICKSVVRRIENATAEKLPKNSRSLELTKQSQAAHSNLILKTPDAYPKRPKSAVLLSGERLTKAKKFEKPTEYINMIRPYDMQHLTLGSHVLLGPQNLAKVVALPESHIALVQMDLIPSINGSVKVFAKDQDEHYCYVDIRKLTYDHAGRYWKPRGAVGDKVTLQLDDEIVVSTVAEEKALKREKSKMTSKTTPARPVYSAGAKKEPSQRPLSPDTSRRVSPVNSLTFISREQSRVENEEPGIPIPTKPLSAIYCERMELTLSGLSHQTDSQFQFFDDPRRPYDHPENGVYAPTFVTQNPPPTLDSDPLEASGVPLQTEKEYWEEKVDGLLEEQTSKSQGSYVTDGSSVGSEKHNEQISTERSNENEEVLEEPDRSPGSTSQVSFRMPEHIRDDVSESVEDVVYDNEEELEQQLQNANLADEDEPELQQLLQNGNHSESVPQPFEQYAEQETATLPDEVQKEHMKLLRKLSSRKWFAVSGETLALQKRLAADKKPRVRSAADAKPKRTSTGPPSRPVSAIVTPKRLLSYQKDFMSDDSRPGSASSFQMMRTEAWRSSASSASTGFPTSTIDAAKYTQFVVNDQLNKGSKVKFSMRMKRPPPQRPTSPDHTREEENVVSAPPSFVVPPKLTLTDNLIEVSQSEPLSTSRWLAQGRNIYQEDVLTRQQVLAAQRIPGYLDGVYLPPNLLKKRRFIAKGSVGIDALPSRPIKPSAMHPYTHHRRSSGERLPRSRSVPVSQSVSYSRPRFSTLGGLKCISSLPPSHISFRKPMERF